MSHLAHAPLKPLLAALFVVASVLLLAIVGPCLPLAFMEVFFLILWAGFLVHLVQNRNADGQAASMFLFLTFTVFIFSRIILSLTVGIGDYRELDWMISKELGNKEAQSLLIVLCVFLLGAFLGLHRHRARSQVESSDVQMRLGLMLIVVGAPFCMVKAYHAYKLLGEAGYLMIYLRDGSPDQGIISLVASFGILGFYMFAAAGPGKRPLVLSYLLFLVMIATTLTMGSRGTFVCNLIAGTWLFTRISRIRFRLSVLVPLLLGLLICMDWLGNVRLGRPFGIQNIFLGVTWFVYSQGVSLIVPAVIISDGVGLGFKDGVLALLTPLEGVFHVLTGTGAGQSATPGANSFSLAAKVSYALNPVLYAQGSGIGTAMIAEAYLLGGLAGVFIAGILLFKLLGMFHTWGERSAANLFVFSYVLSFILFLPRETTFFFMIPLVKALLLRAVLVRLSGWNTDRIHPDSEGGLV